MKKISLLKKNCGKNLKINKKQINNQKIEQIAEEILNEHKYAFEVLGNGKIQ